MPDEAFHKAIVALTYTDGERAAALLRRLVDAITAKGARCAGFIQKDAPPPESRTKCDMMLECLATGARLKISEDRGPLARGCRLDADALSQSIVSAMAALQERPDVLVINKFGKTEAEGGGFRPLIADALELGIPVLIAVPWRNIDSWRLFAGDHAIEISADMLQPDDEAQVLAAIGLETAAGVPAPEAGPHVDAPTEQDASA